MTELPSLSLLRELSDQHVVNALAEHGRLTRAEIATHTGLSKPTVSESVKRLRAAGAVREVGTVRPAPGESAGRGRAGTNVELDPSVGCALAVSAGPDGVHAQALGVDGSVVRMARRPVEAPLEATELAQLIGDTATEALSQQRVRSVVIAVADAVDRRTGRLVHLDESPFVHGELDLRTALHGLRGIESATVEIDNDANWAALAERTRGVAQGADDVAFVYLGDGLGLGLVLDGHVIRGRTGLAGEIGYLPAGLTDPYAGRRGLVSAFRELGLARAHGTAIDSAAVTTVLDSLPTTGDPLPTDSAADPATASAAATTTSTSTGTTATAAVSDGAAIDSATRGHIAKQSPSPAQRVVALATGLVATISAVVEPGLVVLAGPWGRHPRLVDEIARAAAEFSVPTTVQAAEVEDGPLAGATDRAINLLRANLTA